MLWTIAAVLVCVLLIAAVLVKVYIKLTTGWDYSYTCLAGKTIIVTGANSGIGYVSAKEFAKRGARVIMACRNTDKAKEAREQIVNETNNENVVVKQLDLASFDSVKNFAKDVDETETQIDVLLNNAAASITGSITDDGIEETMQTNYFATSLLTILLIDVLKRSAPSRIINVSSKISALTICVNPDEIRDYRFKPLVYAASKLCLIMFTKELASKLIGTGISVFSLHPGVIDTKLYDYIGKVWGKIIRFFIYIFYKNVEEGAQTQIFVCAAKGLETESGAHFEDCKKVADYRTARNREKRERLWKNTVAWLDASMDGEISKKLEKFTDGKVSSRV